VPGLTRTLVRLTGRARQPAFVNTPATSCASASARGSDWGAAIQTGEPDGAELRTRSSVARVVSASFPSGEVLRRGDVGTATAGVGGSAGALGDTRGAASPRGCASPPSAR